MPDQSTEQVKRAATATRAPNGPRCLRCGFAVLAKPAGCKSPCPNCGFLYPLGDCAD